MLTTTDTSIPTLLKSGSAIQSVSKATMEINYNSLYEKINTGCYYSTRTNLMLNTSFMVNNSGVPTSWALMAHPNSTGSTLTVNTTTSNFGSNSGAIFRGTYVNPNNNYAFMNQTVSLIAGKVYTVSASVYSSATAPAGSDGAWIVFRNESSAYDGTGFAVTANTWVRISKTFTAKTTASTHVISIGYEGAGTAGTTLLVDGVLLEEGNTLDTYFDGSSTNAYWEGISHNSKSILPSGSYSTYYRTDSNYYDNGTAYQLFEAGTIETTMIQATAGSYSVTVASANSIISGMKVVGESIPADTYVTSISGTNININKPTAAVIVGGTKVSFISYKSVVDKERDILTPLSSIFTPNRPDPGIINLTAYKKGSRAISLENIKMGNFGSVYSGTITDRVYPMGKNSNFKYWNSVRQIKSSNILTTVGLSDSTQKITNAGPFVVYGSPFYSNKISIKTQKYDGNYPVSFKVEYLPYDLTTVDISSVSNIDSNTKILFTTSTAHGFKVGDYVTTTVTTGSGFGFTTQQVITDVPGTTTFKIESTNTVTTGTGKVTRVVNTTWTTAMSFTDSTQLSDGILDIYYDGTSWSTTAIASNKFTSTDTNAVRMYGVRISITKMSAVRIPAEIIEISPRLILDITDYTMSFNYSKAIATSSYGMPVSGTVAGSGSIVLSNVDKYFSNTSGVSIIKDALVQGVEIKLYQTINTESIPLGTFYATDWSESGEYTTTVSLEDYFYFLKRIKSPEISIANVGGIEASAAILILLDNAGITNYKFVKQNSTSNDDFIFDYFFTNKTDTLADTLEQIAISAQYAIYVDANNIIRAVTKEKMADLVAASSTDLWIVGTENWVNGTDSEYSYLNGSYIANTVSISESKVIPITEAEIQFAGVGIKRQPKELLKRPELFNDKNVPYYNASIINRGLSFVNTELWSIDSGEAGSDKVLLSMPYINEISNTRPSILTTAATGNNQLVAASQNDLIRTIYTNATATEKKYFEIVVDQERGTEIIQSQKFNGYVVIDAELIKYNGVVVDVFDEKTPVNSGRFIVFDNAELQYIKNKASTGTSVLCYSILVEIQYKAKPITTALASNTITYEFLSDGRGEENSQIAKHTAQATSDMLANVIRTKLYATTVSSAISPQGTMSSKSVNLLDPRNPSSGNTVSYPGYLKISGPKSIGDVSKLPDYSDSSTGPKLAINNLGEQFITGLYKTLDFSPHKISTRMRLLEKPKKDVYTGKDANKKYAVENRGIAGIGFSLDTSSSNGVTGYFIEIEDIGNIQPAQLETVDFKNLRFYKVIKSGSTYTPVLLTRAWVNVSAVAGESIDFGSVILNEGRSYAGTSDLSVVIEPGGSMKPTVYKIYWNSNLVCKYTEDKGATKPPKTNTIGLIVRSDSEAMFDYLLATASSQNGKYQLPALLSPKTEYMTETEAAERGLLPVSISKSMVGSNGIQYSYEDFGNQMREAKRFTVTFQKPSVMARLISLTKTNKDYYVTDFSYSSRGAEFWVFNTGRASIGLSLDMNTPVIISGVALEEINPGTITLSDYLKNKSSSYLEFINLNKNKYGENAVTLSGNYLNNLDQAQKHLEWIYNKCGTLKKEFDISIFPNPLLEIGDKVRIFNSDINHTIALLGTDKVYYVSSITYSVSENGPEMNIRIREV